MLRYLWRTTFQTPKYSIWFLLSAILIIFLDARAMPIESEQDFRNKFARTSLHAMNVSYGVAYESEEAFMEGYVVSYHETLPETTYVLFARDQSGAPILSCLLLAPFLIGMRYKDRSLQLACRAGWSRGYQVLCLLVWFYTVVFALYVVEVLAYLLRLYLFSHRLPSTAQVIRLLLLRPLYAASFCSIAACFGLLLRNTFATCLASFGLAFLMSNRSPLQALDIDYPIFYQQSNDALWAPHVDTTLLASVVAVSLACLLFFSLLAYLCYRGREITH